MRLRHDIVHPSQPETQAESVQLVRQHGNRVTPELHSQALTGNIDGRDDVRVFRLQEP